MRFIQEYHILDGVALRGMTYVLLFDCTFVLHTYIQSVIIAYDALLGAVDNFNELVLRGIFNPKGEQP